MERQELETVIYEKDGPIARIILNRPEKANAQNSAMVWDVENSLKDAERDYLIKVVILKANGRGFCSGHAVADGPNAFEEFNRAREAGHPWKGQEDLFLWPVLHLWEFEKPTISAVQGYAMLDTHTVRTLPETFLIVVSPLLTVVTSSGCTTTSVNRLVPVAVVR